MYPTIKHSVQREITDSCTGQSSNESKQGIVHDEIQVTTQHSHAYESPFIMKRELDEAKEEIQSLREKPEELQRERTNSQRKLKKIIEELIEERRISSKLSSLQPAYDGMLALSLICSEH